MNEFSVHVGLLQLVVIVVSSVLHWAIHKFSSFVRSTTSSYHRTHRPVASHLVAIFAPFVVVARTAWDPLWNGN